MPFTFSHPAAVLPLKYIYNRPPVLTSLVIGSMIPDFEYFLRMKDMSWHSHTWPGVIWFDLPLGIIVLLIYTIIVKDKLIAHLPAGINRRLSEFEKDKKSFKGFQWYLVAAICIVIGAASHIIWDSFTHPFGYFVTHHWSLQKKYDIGHHGIELFNILQNVSSVVGALIIAIAIYRLPKGKFTGVGSKQIFYYWIQIIAIALFVLLIRLSRGLSIKYYPHVVVTTISGFLIGLILVSLVTPIKKQASNTGSGE